MIAPSMPFPRNRHLYLLLQNSLILPDETNMCNPLLHDHGHGLSPSSTTLVYCILEHLNGNAVPPHPFTTRAHFFHQCEVAIQL